MKKLITTLVILVCSLATAQVGINTTAPTSTLDVNGNLRVRSLSSGTVESDVQGNLTTVPYKVYAFCVADKSATILKQHNVSSVVSLGAGRFRITFTNAMLDNNYIILAMGNNRHVSYDNVTTTTFEVRVDSNAGIYDFNVMVIDLI